MVEHKCDRCGKIFKHKTNFKRHLNRKYPCTQIIHNRTQTHTEKSETCDDLEESSYTVRTQTNEKVKHGCKWCKYLFSQKSSLTRHINKYCKIKKDIDNEEKRIYLELLEDMSNMKSEMEKLKNENNQLKINNSQINSNNTNITNIQNNNMNVNLVPFGHEDFNTLSEKELLKLMKRGYKSLTELIKIINFNKNRPENNNIYSNNIKSKYVIAYDGEQWILLDKQETIIDMINRYGGHIEDKYYELDEKLDEFAKRKLSRFVKNYSDIEALERYQNDITLILYNNKDIIKDRRKKLENKN